MKKSVYSLVLSDAIIEAVDRAAYLNGTSRSNYINSVLAEHLSYTTPEMRMRDIFGILETGIGTSSGFKVVNQPSESMFSLLSSLKYKYRPTIKYSIELFSSLDDDTVGELKVFFRTQSTELLEIMKKFFVAWAKAEQRYIGKVFAKSPIKYTLSAGKFTRTIKTPPVKTVTEKDLGRAILLYIQMFDRVLKAYVENLYDSTEFLRVVDKEYSAYLKNTKTVI